MFYEFAVRAIAKSFLQIYHVNLFTDNLFDSLQFCLPSSITPLRSFFYRSEIKLKSAKVEKSKQNKTARVKGNADVQIKKSNYFVNHIFPSKSFDELVVHKKLNAINFFFGFEKKAASCVFALVFSCNQRVKLDKIRSWRCYVSE